MTTKVSDEEYAYATNSYMGWCTACKEFTRECTEPDATEYDCDKCGQNTVMGAEQAVIEGEIEPVLKGERDARPTVAWQAKVQE